MKLDEPLTFPAAAKEIGWEPDANGDYQSAGRRLKRRCLKREQERRTEFVERDGAGRPMWVTIGALSRFLPECVPSRVDTLAATLRPVLEEVERRAREIVVEHVAHTVEPELQRLHNRDEELAKEIARVATAMVAMSAAMGFPPAAPKPLVEVTTGRRART